MAIKFDKRNYRKHNDKNKELINKSLKECGSGSTLIACEQLNRKCFMMELDEKYCSVILQRYINFKGNSEDVYLLNNDGTKTRYEDLINEKR